MKIQTFIKKYRYAFIALLVVVLAVAAYSYYRSHSNNLLDTEAFKDIRTAINDIEESEAGGFSDAEELSSFITDWADSHSVNYVVDKSGNIIFDMPAAKRKKKVTPTVIAVSMNHETAVNNASLYAAALSVALTDVESGRKTVIFFNDEQNLAKGYKKISKKYISDRSKIIYMDQGSSFYLSTSSFREVISRAIIPAEREESTLDTAIRVKIGGIKSGEIGTAINKQPDPISAVSALLTRLKSKSAICRLADIKVTSNGNMYPTDVEATFTMNSYAVGSFTAYMDKRIKAWEKAYGDSHEGIEYTYEVLDDPNDLPKTVYTSKTTDALTSVLYTAKTGTYRYSEGDPIPADKKEGDIFGINCATDLKADDDTITIRFLTQGYDEMYTDRILTDNRAAAELYGCKYKINKTINEFINNRDSLSRVFSQTYKKVNSKITPKSSLETMSDNFFTPCSYLASKNEEADIIHIRINSSNAANLANTVLCYIKAKGNTSIFG